MAPELFFGRKQAKQAAPDATASRSRTRLLTLSGSGNLAAFILPVVAAVAFFHWPVLNAKAINLDDQQYLFDNPVLQHPSWASAGVVLREVFKSSAVRGYYEPLTLLSLMVDVALGGRADNLKPFHVTSLALHLMNTALIIVLLYMLFSRPLARDERFAAGGNELAPRIKGQLWVAAAVGLLFGVHPMGVEPVAWVWERKTVLAAFFALWCLILYVGWVRRPKPAVYIGSLLMFVLALMAKPTVTPLPVLLFLLDFWPLRRLNRQTVLEKVPFLMIAGLSAVVTIVSTARNAEVTFPDEHALSQLPLKVCYLIAFYLCKIVWPVNLSSIYLLPEPMALSHPLVLGAVVAICVLMLLLVVSLRWTRALVTGGLFFIVAMSPMLGAVQYSWVAASDKYAYIPAIGLLIVLASCLNQLIAVPSPPRGAWQSVTIAFGILVVAGLLGVGTKRYLQEWQTTERHCSYMLGLAPRSPNAHLSWGNVLTEKGEPDQAILHYTRAIDLQPDYAMAYNNRGSAYNELQDYDRAIRDCNTAIALKADLAEPYYNRGNAYLGMGSYDRAIEDYTRAIELAPAYAKAYNSRGIAHGSAGDFARAIRDCIRAIELKPDYANAYQNLAVNNYGLGKYDEAWANIERCKALGGTVKPEFIRVLTQASSRPG